ncbi:MAG: MATE family efflux transporter [Methanobrevibacter sp.]|uniref:MATE family efflux transporter n=1 Tax=Methanobrevibacter sp. TaxID=66852 RepID=UPI0025D31FF0|nr:MATE family efflux transporter [Methanobrevibacter sp.]MBQ6139457.1 MATE family efflux transporter [Methanobrevibacter sp.]
MEMNENVEMITGDPKKAINKLAWPMIASMFLIFLNNIVDSIWVAGLGPGPLAAIGYVTPLFMVLVGFGNGIGAGATSLISRYIGAEKRDDANNAAIHSAILSVVISLVLTVFFLLILESLLKVMGASEVMGYAMDYGLIIFAFTAPILIPPIFGGAFRAEGDVKRATLPIAMVAIVNMILDPIFIYTFGWGISGAALATGLAPFVGLIMMLYWIFIKKDTYLSYNRKDFHNNFKMYNDILVVGIPASLEQLIMAALAVTVNYMLTLVSGSVAVAVYTAGWRIISLGLLPAIGVGTAAITVAGVAYGAKKYENIRTACRYSVKLGLISSIIVCILLFVFANQVAFIFSYSEASSHLEPLIASFIQLMCLFILYVPFGASAGNVFQGLGKGTTSFILTTFREFVLVLIFAYLLGFVFNMGERGIYYGMLLGGFIGSVIAYGYIELYVDRLIKGKIKGSSI